MEEYNIYWHKYNEGKEYLIGYLKHYNNWFFLYNKPVIEKVLVKGFCPFPEMPVIDNVYISKDQFKTFVNRLNQKLLTDNIICLETGMDDEAHRYYKHK